MRPREIIWFEILYLGMLALLFVEGVLDAHESHNDDPANGILVAAFILAPLVALVLLASRRRSRIAKWLLACLAGYLLATGTWDFLFGWFPKPSDIAIPAVLGCATFLLFTPAARAWLGGAPQPSDLLRRTFE